MTIRDAMIQALMRNGSERLESIDAASECDKLCGVDMDDEVPKEAEDLVVNLITAICGMASDLYELAADDDEESEEESWRN